MYHLFFITTLQIFSASSQKYGLIHFSKDKATLYKCLEDHFDTVLSDEVNKIIKNAINTVSRTFSRKTLKKESIDPLVSLSIDLINEQWYHLLSNDSIRAEIESRIKEALLECSDDESDSGITSIVRNNSEFNNELIRQTLPHFINEASGIGLLLDYILVNWPYPLKDMIRTRSRRALLRRFVEDSLRILDCALDSSQTQHAFQFSLRDAWRRRSQLFFDSRNIRLPYIDHIYTSDYPAPHSHGDTEIFASLSLQSLRDREPPAFPSDVERIFFIYGMNGSINDICDIFFTYERRRMTSAEHYLETHIIQFYRVLFFFLELQSRGISTVIN